MKITINTDSAKYAARAWRTDVLRQEAAEQVSKMLQAFVPEGFYVLVVEQEHEVPGFPYATPYKFRATLRASDPDGSDAHMMVSGHTRAGVEAHLLAAILDKVGCFFPLT